MILKQALWVLKISEEAVSGLYGSNRPWPSRWLSQQVRVLATKPGDLSSIPISGTHMVEGENSRLRSLPYTQTLTLNCNKKCFKRSKLLSDKACPFSINYKCVWCKNVGNGISGVSSAFSHHLMSWNLEMSIPSSAAQEQSPASSKASRVCHGYM